MNKRYVAAGLGLLALTGILATCGTPVALKTGSLYPDASPGMVGCYTSGISGQLVADDAAGTAIIDSQSGHRYAVTWPPGYTGRSRLGEVEVVRGWGTVVVARTGSRVNMSGGFWTDGSFLACGEVH
jgi:hypothetical protein